MVSNIHITYWRYRYIRKIERERHMAIYVSVYVWWGCTQIFPLCSLKGPGNHYSPGALNTQVHPAFRPCFYSPLKRMWTPRINIWFPGLRQDNYKKSLKHLVPENKNMLKEWGDMLKRQRSDFRGGPVVKNLPSNAGDLSWVRVLRSHMSQATNPVSHNKGKAEHCN